jgi:cell division transport system permease protein
MKGLAAEIKSFEGVDEVSFGQEWVKNYSLITKLVSSAGLIFIFITVLGSLFVVSNSIRTSVAQRKNEIEVLELIGATSSYIRWPFIAEGAVLGMLSTFISVGVSYGLFSWAKSGLQQQLNFLQLSSHVQFLGVQISFFFVLSGIFLGALSALVCVRQINSGWAAARSQIKLNGD